MNLTRKQKAIAVLLFMILVVPQLCLLVIQIRNPKSIRQGQPIRGPNEGLAISIPDNTRVDIVQFDIDGDAGILMLDMNITLDDGFYYIQVELPIKGTQLKFKEYQRLLRKEAQTDGAN